MYWPTRRPCIGRPGLHAITWSPGSSDPGSFLFLNSAAIILRGHDMTTPDDEIASSPSRVGMGEVYKADDFTLDHPAVHGYCRSVR